MTCRVGTPQAAVSHAVRRPLGELLGERLQLLDALEDFGELGVDELGDLVVRLRAVDAIPDRKQIADLFEREPDALGMGHERQAGDRVVVIAPVAIVGACRAGQQADPLVVPDRRGRHSCLVGQLGDLHK